MGHAYCVGVSSSTGKKQANYGTSSTYTTHLPSFLSGNSSNTLSKTRSIKSASSSTSKNKSTSSSISKYTKNTCTTSTTSTTSATSTNTTGITSTSNVGVDVLEISSGTQSNLTDEETSSIDFYADYAIDLINSEISDSSTDTLEYTYDGMTETNSGYKITISDNDGHTYQINSNCESSQISGLIKSYLSPSTSQLSNEYSEMAFTQYGIQFFNNEESRDNYIEKCNEDAEAEKKYNNLEQDYIEKIEEYTQTELDEYSLQAAKDLLKKCSGNLNNEQKEELKNLEQDLKTAERNWKETQSARKKAANFGFDNETINELYSWSQSITGDNDYDENMNSKMYYSNLNRLIKDNLIYSENYDEEGLTLDICA